MVAARLRGIALCALAVLGAVTAQAVPVQDIALNGTAYSPQGEWGGIHTIRHLNDATYGNSFSWIPAGGSVAPWDAGIKWPGSYRVDAVAFGRENIVGGYGDRLPMNFTIQGQLAGGGFTTQVYYGPLSGNIDGWNYLDELEVFGFIPEPASLTLLALGLGALRLRRRR